MFSLVLLALLPLASGQKQWVPDGKFPATGNDTIAGGIFCISLPDLGKYLLKIGGGMSNDVESPKGAGTYGPGSGKYPARMFTDPSLPQHTLYAPTNPPADLKMPFLTWGNGGCGTDGAAYKNFLTEIASHGYFIAADGAPSKGSIGSSSGLGGLGLGSSGLGSGQSKPTDPADAIAWAQKGGAAKYGNLDLDKIAAMGHSCGGLEAMSNGYHNENTIKLMMLFGIAIFQDNKRYLLKDLKRPVAWFVGGPKDMGTVNANKDYDMLPEKLPAYYASLNAGHMGTYAATNGGKFGKAAVNYLNWQFKGDAQAKAACLEKGSGSLTSDNWEVKSKNWP